MAALDADAGYELGVRALLTGFADPAEPIEHTAGKTRGLALDRLSLPGDPWTADRHRGNNPVPSAHDWGRRIAVAHRRRRWRSSRISPPTGHDRASGPVRAVLNQVVLRSAFVAALTFVMMIGSFFIAEQHLQRDAGYSPLGASTVVLVAVAAPLAGALADRGEERLPATAGSRSRARTVRARPPRRIAAKPGRAGCDRPCRDRARAAVRAGVACSAERDAARLARTRVVRGAVVRAPGRRGDQTGAALAGLALTAGADATVVHHPLLAACSICLFVGIPASARMGACRPTRWLRMAAPWWVRMWGVDDRTTEGPGVVVPLRRQGKGRRFAARCARPCRAALDWPSLFCG